MKESRRFETFNGPSMVWVHPTEYRHISVAYARDISTYPWHMPGILGWAYARDIRSCCIPGICHGYLPISLGPCHGCKEAVRRVAKGSSLSPASCFTTATSLHPGLCPLHIILPCWRAVVILRLRPIALCACLFSNALNVQIAMHVDNGTLLHFPAANTFAGGWYALTTPDAGEASKGKLKSSFFLFGRRRTRRSAWHRTTSTFC